MTDPDLRAHRSLNAVLLKAYGDVNQQLGEIRAYVEGDEAKALELMRAIQAMYSLGSRYKA